MNDTFRPKNQTDCDHANALHEYEAAHKIWMNTSVFTKAGKIAKADKESARERYETALAANRCKPPMNNSQEETLPQRGNGPKISEQEARIRDYLKTPQTDPFYAGHLTYLIVVLDAERLRITQLKTQLQELIASVKSLPENWRNAAEAQSRVADKHAEIYGTTNETYVEGKERWRALRDCAEHLEAVLE